LPNYLFEKKKKFIFANEYVQKVEKKREKRNIVKLKMYNYEN